MHGMNNTLYAPKKSIKAARKQAGLSQKEAAIVLGRSLRTWQAYECGNRPMSLALLSVFCFRTETLTSERKLLLKTFAHPNMRAMP
jgi:transcriptional regulator with XRE-family HTH domain